MTAPIPPSESSATPTSIRKGHLLSFQEMEEIEARVREEGAVRTLALKALFGPNPDNWDEASEQLPAMIERVRRESRG